VERRRHEQINLRDASDGHAIIFRWADTLLVFQVIDE